jgi:hypothetical protein
VRWPEDPAGWLSPAGLMTAWVADGGGVVVGHAGLVRGMRARCVLQATGRDASQLAGVVRLLCTRYWPDTTRDRCTGAIVRRSVVSLWRLRRHIDA